jgi:hypothetical protein
VGCGGKFGLGEGCTHSSPRPVRQWRRVSKFVGRAKLDMMGTLKGKNIIFWRGQIRVLQGSICKINWLWGLY